MMEYTKYRITINDIGRRIDRIMRKVLPDVPLSAIYKLFRKGFIRFEGHRVAPDFVIQKEGDIWVARLDSLDSFIHKKTSANVGQSIKNEDFPLEIVYKSTDLLCINKPHGFVVHGSNGLDTLIKRYFQNDEHSLSFSIGPLHRLDKETTGLLFFSQSIIGAQWFSKEIALHHLEKRYVGILQGHLEDRSYWNDTTDEGNQMTTEVFPLAYSLESKKYTLVGFRIKTGKKHQIRIQSSKRNLPLLGDVRYGGISGESFFLHAYQVLFPEERLPLLPESLTAPFPSRFISKTDELFGINVLATCLDGTLYWNKYE